MLNWIKKRLQRPQAQTSPSEIALAGQQGQHNIRSAYHQAVSDLQYVHKDPEQMLRRRLQAYDRLAESWELAQKAIPELIRKQFLENDRERQKAVETLERIDPEWQRNRYAEEAILYLLSKLNKERREVNHAVNLLIRIGPAVHTPLMALLNNPDKADPMVHAYGLRVLYKSGANVEPIRAFILGALAENKSMLLVEACLEALQTAAFRDEQFANAIVPFLANPDPKVRRKAVSALKSCAREEAAAVPMLLRPLTDKEESVRYEAIQWLSGMGTPYVDEIMLQIVEQKGELREQDWSALIERFLFFMGRNVIESYRINPAQYWNNVSWQRLELHEQLEKQERMLASALHILSDRRYRHPSLPEMLSGIYRDAEKPEIRNQAIRLMGCQQDDGDQVMTFLVSCLGSAYAEHQKTAAEALTELDPDWISHPIAPKELAAIIERLDGRERDAAQSALLTVGALAAPLLIDYLMKTNNRVLQEAIVGVLDKLESAPNMSLRNLQAVLEITQNAHVRNALVQLIGKLESREKDE